MDDDTFDQMYNNFRNDLRDHLLGVAKKAALELHRRAKDSGVKDLSPRLPYDTVYEILKETLADWNENGQIYLMKK